MSKLPQIKWHGDTLDFGFKLGIAGELKVGNRTLRHAAMFKGAENTLKAAELVEAQLWTRNYYETLREVRVRHMDPDLIDRINAEKRGLVS